MGRRRTLAAAAIVLTVAAACGREGPIASSPTNALPPTRQPIAIPERNDAPVVWTQRSDKVGVRVLMTPGRPVVGDAVRFDVKMAYGNPPYRPGGFNYTLEISEVGAETSSASCGVRTVPAGFAPKPPRPFDDNLRRKVRYAEAGLHTFSLEIRPSCFGAGGLWLKRSFDVRRPPVRGLHRLGRSHRGKPDRAFW